MGGNKLVVSESVPYHFHAGPGCAGGRDPCLGSAMRQWLAIFPVVSLISGCATTTIGPTPVGENKYVMSRQEGAFPSGDEPLLQEVLGQADRFCNSLNRRLELLESHQNPGPYIFGNYPTATITFKCVNR